MTFELVHPSRTRKKRRTLDVYARRRRLRRRCWMKFPGSRGDCLLDPCCGDLRMSNADHGSRGRFRRHILNDIATGGWDASAQRRGNTGAVRRGASQHPVRHSATIPWRD